MATHNWVTIGSRNGLLPDGTKPLPEPMRFYDTHLRPTSQVLIRKTSLKMYLNELTVFISGNVRGNNVCLRCRFDTFLWYPTISSVIGAILCET